VNPPYFKRNFRLDFPISWYVKSGREPKSGQSLRPVSRRLFSLLASRP